jgi:hypothetical protein
MGGTKLFHTVVVIGSSLLAGCGNKDSAPAPEPAAEAPVVPAPPPADAAPADAAPPTDAAVRPAHKPPKQHKPVPENPPDPIMIMTVP